MKNKDFILSFIKEFSGVDRFFFQKVLFLLQIKQKMTSFKFVRKDYGPFSEEIDEILEGFILDGNVVLRDNQLFLGYGFEFSHFDLTNFRSEIEKLLGYSKKIYFI